MRSSLCSCVQGHSGRHHAPSLSPGSSPHPLTPMGASSWKAGLCTGDTAVPCSARRQSMASRAHCPAVGWVVATGVCSVPRLGRGCTCGLCTGRGPHAQYLCFQHPSCPRNPLGWGLSPRKWAEPQWERLQLGGRKRGEEGGGSLWPCPGTPWTHSKGHKPAMPPGP